MKKTLAMLMTATMVLSMGVGASAAENGYSISLQNNKLTLSSSENTVTYQLEEDEILLGQSAAGGIAVSFLDKEDGSKKVSLGEQKQVTVTGDIDQLRISKTLDKEYSIYLDEDADVNTLFSNGDARIVVEGELTKAYLTSGAAKLTAKADSEVDTVYAKNENCVKGLLSHHIKKYEEGTQIDSFNYGPRSSGTYYRNGRSYGYRSDLGVSGIVDRGDRISFDCDVSGATVRWNGSEIGTTDRGSNTFEVDRISEINTVTGEVKNVVSHVAIYPASHYIVPREKMQQALGEIREEMEQRVAYFKANDKLIEAQRIMERTNYDMEMLTEIGFCKGIENYSRVLSGRAPGSCPYTLLDYFPEDFLLFVDESHVTLPQVRGMYGGDQARKKNLVDYGFRLPSAFDNLDADKEGFLRSETSLVQTIGRAARNANGKVIMYADSVTDSMERAISETYRRREVQLKYNEEHGIVPQTIKKDVREILEISTREHTEKMGKGKKRMSQTELRATIEKLTAEMKNAAQILEFEHAAYLRDKIKKLKEQYTANPNLKIMKDAQESSGNKGRKKR